jgi:alpha-L-arabinofuranosidase
MGRSADGAITAFIDAHRTAEKPIPEFIFGGFIEHIGGLINRSLWSEVLDDRKLFRAIDSAPLPASALAITAYGIELYKFALA